MLLFVAAFLPFIFGPPALPPGFWIGDGGCKPNLQLNVARCHVCNTKSIFGIFQCQWLSFPLPAATTTVAPTQKPCSDTYAFPEMVCGVNTDGSVGSCIGYDLSVSTAVILAPLCLVNGRLPRNCRLHSELPAVACRTHD